MGRGRTPRRGSTIAPSAEAKRLLRDDTPQAVKLRLRLALRGGKQQRRRCRQCGAQGVHCRIESQPAHWQVLAPQDAPPITVYWLCTRCYAAAIQQER